MYDLPSQTGSSFSRPAAASLMASFLVALLLVTIFFTATASDQQAIVAAEITPASSNRPITLRDRLVAGLRARLKSEIAFIDTLVAAVNVGKIPQRMVDQTYFWSRIRATGRRHVRPRRPIIYFRPAMTARAKRLGVVL